MSNEQYAMRNAQCGGVSFVLVHSRRVISALVGARGVLSVWDSSLGAPSPSPLPSRRSWSVCCVSREDFVKQSGAVGDGELFSNPRLFGIGGKDVSEGGMERGNRCR